MRSRSHSLNFPRFSGVVRWLVIINLVVFVVQSLLIQFNGSSAAVSFKILALVPEEFFRGWIWQLVTFQFLHASTSHIFFNMIGLWMFGSSMEEYFGSPRFLSFYLTSGVGSALVFLLIAAVHGFGLSTDSVLVGASGGIFAIVLGFGIVFSEAEVFLFPFPVAMKAKYLVMIIFGLAVLSLLRLESPGTQVAHLGGAFTGFLYLKLVPRRGMKFLVSESYYGLLNRFHRWKRRRAAKKFEVFMRQHDRTKYFDEYGNYREPDQEDKGDGKGQGGSGWVN